VTEAELARGNGGCGERRALPAPSEAFASFPKLVWIPTLRGVRVETSMASTVDCAVFETYCTGRSGSSVECTGCAIVYVEPSGADDANWVHQTVLAFSASNLLK
jgi:ribosomal protein S27E